VDKNSSRSHHNVSLANVGVAAIVAISSVGTLCGLAPIFTASLGAIGAVTAVWVAIAVHKLGVTSAIADAGLTAAVASAEAKLANRTIASDQHKEMVHALAPFAGTGILFVRPPDLEPMTLSESILSVLRDSGWSARTWTGRNLARVVAGILVEVEPSADRTKHEAATALAKALASARLAVSGPLDRPRGHVLRGHAVHGDLGPEIGGPTWITLEIGAKR